MKKRVNKRVTNMMLISNINSLQMISNGRPIREVAESLGMGENLIYRWRSGQQPKGKLGQENSFAAIDQHALLQHIQELEMERDICTCRRASASGPKKR